jgi:hypothetical protein
MNFYKTIMKRYTALLPGASTSSSSVQIVKTASVEMHLKKRAKTVMLFFNNKKCRISLQSSSGLTMLLQRFLESASFFYAEVNQLRGVIINTNSTSSHGKSIIIIRMCE